jgi:hypothetical protein
VVDDRPGGTAIERPVERRRTVTTASLDTGTSGGSDEDHDRDDDDRGDDDRGGEMTQRDEESSVVSNLLTFLTSSLFSRRPAE